MATTTVANARQDGVAVEDATGGATRRTSAAAQKSGRPRVSMSCGRSCTCRGTRACRCGCGGGMTSQFVANSRGFDALIGLARTFRAPLLVAIIPGLASEALDVSEADPTSLTSASTAGGTSITSLWAAAKANSVPDATPEAVEAEIAAGQVALARLLGDRSRPIFVPPWNAFDERHLDIVRAREYTGLSTFGPRPRLSRSMASGWPTPISTSCNGRHQAARDRCRSTMPACAWPASFASKEKPEADAEPIGILSHHRAMRGEDPWSLLEGLLWPSRACRACPG